MDRRRIILSAPVVPLAAMWPLATAANPAEIAKLARAAEAKGPVTWYESSPSEQADKVIAAFTKKHPGVKLRHTRLIGGNELAVRGVQEVQARGYTGDVLTGGADHIWQLGGRGILDAVNWATIGVPKAMTPTAFALATTASVYVLVWNTRKVPEAQVPKTWAEVLDPKWAGKIGTWVRAAAFAQLAATQGPDTAKRWLERHIAQKPMLFKSTFPLAQAVGAGEVDIGIGFYHSTLPPIKAGAPVQMRSLDVVPMHTIYSATSKAARNPEGARVFLAWLAGEEGALAYEEATGRGNPLHPRTQTAGFIKGKTLSEWPPEKSEELGALNEYYNKLLEAVGAAR
jgi:iron(III) transport system substrate-binding protein